MSSEDVIESITIPNVEGENLENRLLIGLKCGVDCDHTFCLKYLIKHLWKSGVYRFTNLSTGQLLHGKVIRRTEYERYQNNRNILPKINEILPVLNHPKLVKYYGLTNLDTKMILFAETLNGVKLRDIITPNEPLKTDMIYRYCKDILQAIAFLHDNKILHRFIHPPNIYMDNNGVCKLAISIYSYSLADGDFQINNNWLSVHKDYSFDAPELVENGILSYSYDILFLGCTVIEMSTGIHFDYKSINFDDLEGIIQRIPNEMLQSFIRSMIMRNPTERATANELLNHELMTNNNIL